jgi:cytochrome d ubiquinol oxidase subunit II
VGTFFTGSAFTVNKNAVGDAIMPTISQWTNAWHGLEAVTNPFNVAFGLMVMLLAVSLGALYMINNISNEELSKRLRKSLLVSFTGFLVIFLFVVYNLFTMEGFAVNENGIITMQEGKYLTNIIDMPIVLIMFLIGAVLLVAGVALTLIKHTFTRGIWPSAIGTVMAVMAIFMIAGYNGTAYYASVADLQSSLTLANSCSSEFTLKTMAIVSLIIPFVVAYIAYFWHKMDKKQLTREEIETSDKY